MQQACQPWAPAGLHAMADPLADAISIRIRIGC
jgi:hypothetical protein